MAYDLSNFSLSEKTKCGMTLRNAGAGALNMEGVTGRIVRHLYDNLLDAEGQKACALVRFFKTHYFGELKKEDQEFARGMLITPSETPDMKCLTLMATAGDKEEWNSRKASVGHRAIPLPSRKVVEATPMISQLIHQLGLDINRVLNPDPKFVLESAEKRFNVFHVPQALNNPYIPAQKEFVIPFGIKSVLGFGGILPSGDLFAVIMFMKVDLPYQIAAQFKTIALNVKLAILPFEKESIFA